MRRLSILAACAFVVVTSACSSSVKPEDNSSTTSVEFVPSTTVFETTTTTTLPPLGVTPSTTSIPPSQVPRAKNAVGDCEFPEGSHYCIWGTEPIDLVVNNSRTADVAREATQTFTAVSTNVTMAQIPLRTTDIGELQLRTAANSQVAPCLSVLLFTSSGYPVASAVYVNGGGFGRYQTLEVPLRSNLRVGEKYSLQIVKSPACATSSLAIRIAMSTLWKYPQAYGELSVDGRKSIGSLWARID